MPGTLNALYLNSRTFKKHYKSKANDNNQMNTIFF